MAPGLTVRARRTGSAALLGGAFAVVAAPCIGTVLASILVLAGSTGDIARGVVLLLAYSLGLGAAFVLAGVAFAHAMRWFRWVRSHYQALRIVSGVMLISLGLLLFFDKDWWLRYRALPGLREDRPQHVLATCVSIRGGNGEGLARRGRSLSSREARSAAARSIASRPQTGSTRRIS